MTLELFSLPFNVHVMIPVGSYWFLNLASMSLHHHPIWHVMKRLANKGGRADPESKAMDTYA